MISLSNVLHFSPPEANKLHQALSILNFSLKDPKFKSIFMSLHFDYTNDTNEEIWGNLSKDGTISSLDIENLSWWATHVSRTIAYEENDKITFNRYYYNSETLPALVNTLFHEWLHACGYRHASSTDYNSVPYQAGRELEEYLDSMDSDEFYYYVQAASSSAQTSSENATTS